MHYAGRQIEVNQNKMQVLESAGICVLLVWQDLDGSMEALVAHECK